MWTQLIPYCSPNYQIDFRLTNDFNNVFFLSYYCNIAILFVVFTCISFVTCWMKSSIEYYEKCLNVHWRPVCYNGCLSAVSFSGRHFPICFLFFGLIKLLLTSEEHFQKKQKTEYFGCSSKSRAVYVINACYM